MPGDKVLAGSVGEHAAGHVLRQAQGAAAETQTLSTAKPR